MNRKTYIIAEFAQSFEGDVNLCKKLVSLAKRCGADAVKFQIFAPNELCTADYEYYDLFRQLEMKQSEWKEVMLYSKELGLEFLADVFGAESLSWLEQLGADGFKIHSTDVKNYDLLRAISQTKSVVYLATGGSKLSEVEDAIELLENANLKLLSGFQAGPNQFSDVELDKIEYLQKHFNLEVGYADHIDAKDQVAVQLPAMAVLKGATIIEKHLTFEREYLELEDSMSALNPSEFKEMVALIEKVEQFTVTKNKFELSEREEAYRVVSKKVVLAKRSIPKGTTISAADLVLLRTGQEAKSVAGVEEVIGKTTNVDIAPEMVVSPEMLV